MVLGGGGGASSVLLTHHQHQWSCPSCCFPSTVLQLGSAALAALCWHSECCVEAACVPDYTGYWEDEQILGDAHLCPELYSEHLPKQGVAGPVLFISL